MSNTEEEGQTREEQRANAVWGPGLTVDQDKKASVGKPGKFKEGL